MYDLFEYPNMVSDDAKELSQQINNYLVQFKETLEFALMNISTDNLSEGLVTKLNSLGADIKTTREEQEDQIQQVVNKSITVSDVINSTAYKASIQSLREDMEEDLKLTINYETGNLEYTIKETET